MAEENGKSLVRVGGVLIDFEAGTWQIQARCFVL